MIKADADEEIKDRCRSNNKHQYQSNRTFIIGQFRAKLIRIISGLDDISRMITILEGACLTRSQIQPGRK